MPDVHVERSELLEVLLEVERQDRVQRIGAVALRFLMREDVHIVAFPGDRLGEFVAIDIRPADLRRKIGGDEADPSWFAGFAHATICCSLPNNDAFV